ncbi:MAG: hypothetical protein P4M04_07400 [Acidobacteriota bacterium]|nr:hypothetical protein [Acidobacteriota bacterium]
MAFSIGFMKVPAECPYEDGSTEAARGLIVLGDSAEEFLANLGEWTQAKYREQWRGSIQSLLEGEGRAVLITTFSNPSTASHLEWWALYREGEDVFVQNQLLFFDDIEGEFDESRAVDFLRARETVTEEGRPISEWSVSMEDLRMFSKQT